MGAEVLFGSRCAGAHHRMLCCQTPCRVMPLQIAEFELQQYLHSRRTDTGKPSGARQRQELESRRGPGAYEGAVTLPERLRPHSPSFKFSEFPRYPKPPSSAVPSCVAVLAGRVGRMRGWRPYASWLIRDRVVWRANGWCVISPGMATRRRCLPVTERRG